MTERNLDFISWLGKQAAAYRAPFLVRPRAKTKKKRTTSHSVTYKSDQEQEKQKAALKTDAGNVQPPYRYGRRVK